MARAGNSKTSSSQSSKAQAATKKTAKSAGKKPGRGPDWTFPRHSLEDAIKVARAIEDKHAGNPMPEQLLAQAVGFRQPSDWRFQQLLRSAIQYGLVDRVKGETVGLDAIGSDVVAPSSSRQRQRALVDAFRAVNDFAKVADFYGDKKIPEDEFFENTLARQFGIPRDRLRRFRDVFLRNIDYLRAFDASTKELVAAAEEPESESGKEEPKPSTEQRPSKPSTVREFLDSCFVMMPFGEWFDQYYEDIYAPAVKEAGFEPVRSDELFTTGSVVEQIWEQIQKSAVLLADLTGKNANVFYELGLAHAARKPVVFTTGNLDDVPFDLRHLRVIPYEVREPGWAEKLGRQIASYLKNAREDPERAIPHPFRGFPEEEESEES